MIADTWMLELIIIELKTTDRHYRDLVWLPVEVVRLTPKIDIHCKSDYAVSTGTSRFVVAQPYSLSATRL
jgi:hypothetical protein